VWPLGAYLLFDERRILKEGTSLPDGFLNLSPTAQNEWGMANTRIVGGFELLSVRLKNPERFLDEYWESARTVFLVSLVGCFLFAYLIRRFANDRAP